MRVLNYDESFLVAGGIIELAGGPKQNVGDLSGGSFVPDIQQATNQVRVEIDYNHDGVADSMGTLIDGVLYDDAGGAHSEYYWKSNLTAGEIFEEDDPLDGTAMQEAAVSFEDGNVFTGIGQVIGDAPEILGNFLDFVVEDIWEAMRDEETSVWEAIKDIFTVNDGNPKVGEDSEEEQGEG